MQDRIRNVLPWAECASPLFGGGSPVTQNLSNGQSSINSANTLEESEDVLTPPPRPSEPDPIDYEGDDGGLDIAPEPEKSNSPAVGIFPIPNLLIA